MSIINEILAKFLLTMTEVFILSWNKIIINARKIHIIFKFII
jgi:hypothetical protein